MWRLFFKLAFLQRHDPCESLFDIRTVLTVRLTFCGRTGAPCLRLWQLEYFWLSNDQWDDELAWHRKCCLISDSRVLVWVGVSVYTCSGLRVYVPRGCTVHSFSFTIMYGFIAGKRVASEVCLPMAFFSKHEVEVTNHTALFTTDVDVI